jgi:phosphatidylcholine synthase
VMFALLGVALIIDGTDGWFARRLRVAERLPRWSGEVLDHVVDFLTYVFVPAFAIATGAILPQPFAIPAAIAIVVSGALYFADTEMKTADGFFRGFPVLWNLAAFYLFLTQPQPYLALAIVAVLVVLTFAPFHFVHPLRAKRWTTLNLIMLAAWAALALAAIVFHMSPPFVVKGALVAVAAYFVAVGLMRPLDRTS